MSDWQVGDLALCVGSKRGLNGRVFTVRETWTGPLGSDPSVIALGLRFYNFPDPSNKGAWNAKAFRKITPGADIEGVEEPRRLPVKERADA